LADPVDDWLCAASSALIVAGDICEPPPNPEAAVGLVEAEAPVERSNGLAGGCGDVDFVEVSELRASSAADAAPRASSMTELQPKPRSAATPIDQQTACHRENPIKQRFFGSRMSCGPGN
jgi:hypothetical protein